MWENQAGNGCRGCAQADLEEPLLPRLLAQQLPRLGRR